MTQTLQEQKYSLLDKAQIHHKECKTLLACVNSLVLVGKHKEALAYAQQLKKEAKELKDTLELLQVNVVLPKVKQP